jgi:hypothetical protein
VYRLGATALFRETLRVSGELRRRQSSPGYKDQTTAHLGAEVWFQDAFAARGGIDRERLTAGLGLRIQPIQIDVALLTNRRLGNLYRLSLTVAP